MGRLDQLDLNKQLTEEAYDRLLTHYQYRLAELQRELGPDRSSIVIGYEGWDAAGKGGSILRLTQQLDPRGYTVHAIGPPTDEEKAHHYLWRFWTRLPRRGDFGIFDRTWYGRVLVERIEGFATEPEWRRAYDEINAFERTLAADGTVIVKFWLHISPEKQLERFQERLNNPRKRWKITEDDWRNRGKWDEYRVAAEEMFARTDTPEAPWTLVEAEHKWYARVKTLKTVVEAVERALGAPTQPPPVPMP